MQKKQTKLFAWVVLSAIVAMMFAACGATNTSVPAPATAAPVATTAAPKPTTAVPAATTAAPAPSTAAATVAATAVATNDGKPLIVGLLTTKTGAFSYYGDMQEKGFMIGLEYFTKGTNKIEGREIKVLVEDDAGDANKAVEAARKLVQQNNADILVGTISSASALAVAAVNEKELKKIFIVEPAADASITGAAFNQYTFRTGRNTDQDAAVGAGYAASLATKTKKIASMFQDYAFGQGGNKSWKESALKVAPGIEWVEIAVPTAATDFTPYIQKLLDTNADVFILNWAGATTVKLFQQMKENDVFTKIPLVSGIGDSTAVKSQGDAAIGGQGVVIYWHQFPKNAENDYLVKVYNEKYKTFPDIFAPGGFSAASALFTGLGKTKGDATADKLIPAMEGMSFPTPKGTMTFRKEDHQALQTMYLAKLVKDPSGKFDFPIPQLIKEVSPQESAPPLRITK